MCLCIWDRERKSEREAEREGEMKKGGRDGEKVSSRSMTIQGYPHTVESQHWNTSIEVYQAMEDCLIDSFQWKIAGLTASNGRLLD